MQCNYNNNNNNNNNNNTPPRQFRGLWVTENQAR